MRLASPSNLCWMLYQVVLQPVEFVYSASLINHASSFFSFPDSQQILNDQVWFQWTFYTTVLFLDDVFVSLCIKSDRYTYTISTTIFLNSGCPCSISLLHILFDIRVSYYMEVKYMVSGCIQLKSLHCCFYPRGRCIFWFSGGFRFEEIGRCGSHKLQVMT